LIEVVKRPLESQHQELSMFPYRPSQLAALRRFAFDDGEERVDGGSAVVLTHEGAAQLACAGVEDENTWSAAQAAAFLAGEPVTFSWVTPSPSSREGEQAYVCCWITLGDGD
jgi:hypothetical protein